MQCTQNAHCTGTSSFCDTDTNKCTSCTKDAGYSCDNNGNRVQHCRNTNGDIEKTYPESCNADQTCSNGDCITTCTHATAPGTPRATAGNGQCTIRPRAGESTTGYTYQYARNIGGTYTYQASGTFTGLTNGTTYTFRAQRKNTSGSCQNWATSPTVTCAPVAACTAVDGGWSTPPLASTINCGTTWTAQCNNPAPACGGSRCSGTPPGVAGTKCPAGQTCINNSCTTKKAPGDSCTANSQCVSNSCSGGACTCSASSQCAAGYTCTNGSCTAQSCTPVAPSWSAGSCQSPSSVTCGSAIPSKSVSCNTGVDANCNTVQCDPNTRPSSTCSGTGSYCSVSTENCNGTSCVDYCDSYTDTPGLGQSYNVCTQWQYESDFCSGTALLKTGNYYIDSSGSEVTFSGYYGDYSSKDNFKFDNCTIPEARQCSDQSQTQNYYDIDWKYSGGNYVTCTSGGSECSSGQSCLDTSGTIEGYLSYCSPTDSVCACATYEVDYCYHYCSYRLTATTPPNSNGVTTSTRHYHLPTLGQEYHNGTLSFTCEPNECGAKNNPSTGPVSGSVTIQVGATDGNDSTDGCSQGTNYNIHTAAPSAYGTDITWQCNGCFGGATDSTTDDPYRCEAGSFCDGGYEKTVNSSCDLVGNQNCSLSIPVNYCYTFNPTAARCVECRNNNDCSGATPECHTAYAFNFCAECNADDSDCSGSTPYCGHPYDLALRGTCVACRLDSHCSSGELCIGGQCVLGTTRCTHNNNCSVGGLTTGGTDGEHCSVCDKSHNCTGTGVCQPCTWNDPWCHPSQVGNIYRTCKTGTAPNDVVQRYGFIETCDGGETCSGGSCS